MPIIPEMLVTQDQQTIKDCLSLHHNQSTNISFDVVTKSPSLNHSEISFTRKLLQLSFNLATSENSRIGWILSSKALVQILANPVAGYLANG